MAFIETRIVTPSATFVGDYIDYDPYWDEHVEPEDMNDDDYTAWAYAEQDAEHFDDYSDLMLTEEDEVLAYEEGWHRDFVAEPVMPNHCGGTQPKFWWTYSRRDHSGEEQVQTQMRRRRASEDIRNPVYWKFGRDLPDTWEARGRGKNRQIERQLGETHWEHTMRVAKKQHSLRRTDRRKARQTIRTWPAAEVTAPVDQWAELDAFYKEQYQSGIGYFHDEESFHSSGVPKGYEGWQNW